MPENSRIERERKTVNAMIRMFCKGHHGHSDGLCEECRRLAEYADKRLDACPFQEGKTTCGKCPVHCYKPEMRERIRSVMRYSGPRMIRRHPLMALQHLIDGRRKNPVKKRKP